MTHDRLLMLQVDQPGHLIGSCHPEYRWCIQVVVSSRSDPQTGDSVNDELGLQDSLGLLCSIGISFLVHHTIAGCNRYLHPHFTTSTCKD